MRHRVLPGAIAAILLCTTGACASTGGASTDIAASLTKDSASADRSDADDSAPAPLPVTSGTERGLTFAGIPWGTHTDSVRILLAKLGYSRIEKTPEGDLEFQGAALFGHPTLGHAGIAQGQLAKVTLEIIVDTTEFRKLYAGMRYALIKESGPPDDTIESPAAMNDSLRSGGASMFLVWGGPRHNSQSTMTLEVTPELTVAIEYEWSMWAVEMDRRRRNPK